VCGVSILFRTVNGVYLTADMGAGVTLHSEWATGWVGRGANPYKGKMFFPSLNRPDRPWVHLASYSMCTGVLYRGVERPEQVGQVFNNNPQGSRLRGRKKSEGVTVYREILTDAELKTVYRGQDIN